MLQRAIALVLEAVYEQDFLESAVVQFAIAGASGHAGSIEVSGVTSDASRRCVERVIESRARFPLFADASIQLAWRFDLR